MRHYIRRNILPWLPAVLKTKKQRSYERTTLLFSETRKVFSDPEFIKLKDELGRKLTLKLIHGDDITFFENHTPEAKRAREEFLNDPELGRVWKDVMRMAEEIDNGTFCEPVEEKEYTPKETADVIQFPPPK